VATELSTLPAHRQPTTLAPGLTATLQPEPHYPTPSTPVAAPVEQTEPPARRRPTPRSGHVRNPMTLPPDPTALTQRLATTQRPMPT
jgi:hypothetical protein